MTRCVVRELKRALQVSYGPHAGIMEHRTPRVSICASGRPNSGRDGSYRSARRGAPLGTPPAEGPECGGEAWSRVKVSRGALGWSVGTG
jgi:hypothetical protein